jgi:hypothetical protein
MITETDEIAAAIDAAAVRWPDIADERAELLRRLIIAAPAEEEVRREQAREAKRQAIRDNAGGFEGMWPDGWLEELRSEWPE